MRSCYGTVHVFLEEILPLLSYRAGLQEVPRQSNFVESINRKQWANYGPLRIGLEESDALHCFP